MLLFFLMFCHFCSRIKMLHFLHQTKKISLKSLLIDSYGRPQPCGGTLSSQFILEKFMGVVALRCSGTYSPFSKSAAFMGRGNKGDHADLSKPFYIPDYYDRFYQSIPNRFIEFHLAKNSGELVSCRFLQVLQLQPFIQRAFGMLYSCELFALIVALFGTNRFH